ncbi:hypothetical protein [Streptomyces diastaticus]
MTRPLPPHGTYARANGSRGYRDGCTCEPCLAERRRYKKRDRIRRQLGQPGHVDATAARNRLLLLNQTTGWNDLAAEFGGSAANLRDIAFGRRARIKRTTHDRIMTLRPGVSGGQYIDATGSTRRLRALQAIGHTTYAIAQATNVSRSLLIPILDGRATVRRTVADRIAAGYRTLADAPGGATRAINRARAEGWPPPAAWDGDTIDDPTAPIPALADDELSREELAAYRRIEIEHLNSCAVPVHEIADRVGLAVGSVEGILRQLRNGQTNSRDTNKEAAA